MALQAAQVGIIQCLIHARSCILLRVPVCVGFFCVLAQGRTYGVGWCKLAFIHIVGGCRSFV